MLAAYAYGFRAVGHRCPTGPVNGVYFTALSPKKEIYHDPPHEQDRWTVSSTNAQQDRDRDYNGCHLVVVSMLGSVSRSAIARIPAQSQSRTGCGETAASSPCQRAENFKHH